LFDNFFNSLTLNEGDVSFDELNRVIGELNKLKKRKKEKVIPIKIEEIME
jgi:hypothetical protein